MHKIKTDNLQGSIVGNLDAAVIRAISRVCSYLVDGHEYSPKYKRGIWDGRVRLFNTRSLTFPAGLLRKVSDVLIKNKIPFELETTPRPERVREILNWNPDYVPYPYQNEFVTTAVTRRRGILKLATGGGKTLVAARILREIGAPSLFVVDGRDLAHQTVEKFREYMPGAEVGLFGDGVDDRRFITVAIVQAMAHRLGLVTTKNENDEGEDVRVTKPVDEEFVRWMLTRQVAIYDECHGMAAKRGVGSMKFLPNAWFRLGLSATPLDRSDNANLLTISQTGDILLSKTSSELIREGFLARPTIYVVPFQAVIRKKMSYNEAYKQGVTHNVERNMLVVRIVKRALAKSNGRPAAILVLIHHLAHGDILLEMLENEGIPVRLLTGGDESASRKTTLAKFKTGEFPVLIASQIFNKGIDIPNITALVNAGGMKDSLNTQQKLGRALHVDAKEVDVYDIADRKNLHLANHSNERLDVYRSEPEYRVYRLDNP